MNNMLTQGRFRSINELCRGRDHKVLIIEAFNWVSSNEGEALWKRIHAVWANSYPIKFCTKPDGYMEAYPVGVPITHPVHGLIVPERCDGRCVGCVFNEGSRDCLNDGNYGCTPFARGDGEQVIYKKV